MISYSVKLSILSKLDSDKISPKTYYKFLKNTLNKTNNKS